MKYYVIMYVCWPELNGQFEYSFRPQPGIYDPDRWLCSQMIAISTRRGLSHKKKLCFSVVVRVITTGLVLQNFYSNIGMTVK